MLLKINFGLQGNLLYLGCQCVFEVSFWLMFCQEGIVINAVKTQIQHGLFI